MQAPWRNCLVVNAKSAAIPTICRVNTCWYMVWALRNSTERDAILEELDAVHERKILMSMYKLATSAKHSCWFSNLLNEKEQTCLVNFEHRIDVS